MHLSLHNHKFPSISFFVLFLTLLNATEARAIHCVEQLRTVGRPTHVSDVSAVPDEEIGTIRKSTRNVAIPPRDLPQPSGSEVSAQIYGEHGNKEILVVHAEGKRGYRRPDVKPIEGFASTSSTSSRSAAESGAVPSIYSPTENVFAYGFPNKLSRQFSLKGNEIVRGVARIEGDRRLMVTLWEGKKLGFQIHSPPRELHIGFYHLGPNGYSWTEIKLLAKTSSETKVDILEGAGDQFYVAVDDELFAINFSAAK